MKKLLFLSLLIVLITHNVMAQTISVNLNYTSTGQCGAGLGIDIKGYGLAFTHYCDEMYKRADTFTTQNETVISISKQIHDLVTLSVGAGIIKSDRHTGNNEWDSFTKSAVYQVGASYKIWREVTVNCGVMGRKDFLQIYSGVGVGIRMRR
jgi:hypothetical protein